jgi:hypothetical protein
LLCGLLNAYAFATMGMIAGICAIAAFIADAVMLMLSGPGLMHARRFSPAAGILAAIPPAHGPGLRIIPQSAHASNQQPADDGFAAGAPTAHPAALRDHGLPVGHGGGPGLS